MSGAQRGRSGPSTARDRCSTSRSRPLLPTAPTKSQPIRCVGRRRSSPTRSSRPRRARSQARWYRTIRGAFAQRVSAGQPVVSTARPRRDPRRGARRRGGRVCTSAPARSSRISTVIVCRRRARPRRTTTGPVSSSRRRSRAPRVDGTLTIDRTSGAFEYLGSGARRGHDREPRRHPAVPATRATRG